MRMRGGWTLIMHLICTNTYLAPVNPQYVQMHKDALFYLYEIRCSMVHATCVALNLKPSNPESRLICICICTVMLMLHCSALVAAVHAHRSNPD